MYFDDLLWVVEVESLGVDWEYAELGRCDCISYMMCCYVFDFESVGKALAWANGDA